MQFIPGSGWLNLLSGYLIKSTLILAFALTLLFLLRKRSAGLRHLVLSLFLIGLLFLPVLSSVTAGWETGLLPSWQTGDPSPAEGLDLNRDDLSSADSQEGGSAFSEAEPYSGGVVDRSLPFRNGFFAEIKPAIGLGVLALWLLGSAVLVFRLALGLRGAARMTHEGRAVRDSVWKRLLNRFLAAVSLRRKVHLLSHDKIRIPLTWGILRPVVMMPDGSDSWSESQRSSALYHELAHVKRGDFLVMLLARLSRALFWFNPLSWVVFRMMKMEQEKACDELVLKAGIKPSTYAENLLSIRNSVPVHWRPPAAVLGALGKSQLNDRLVAILKQKLNFEEVKMKTKIMLGVLVVLSVSFIGMARPISPEAGAIEADATVMQAPVTIPVAQAVPQEQEKKKQEKKEEKKEKQEAKEEKKGTILVWTAKKGDDQTITITIDNKGEKKTIELKAPYVLTIKETPEKTIVLHSPHLELKKGEGGTWTLKSDKLHVSGDVKTIHLDKGAVIQVKKHGEEGDEVIELTTEAVKLDKHVALKLSKAVDHAKNIDVHVVTKDGDVKKVVVSPNVKVHTDVKAHPNVEVHADAAAHIKAAVHADVAAAVKQEVYKKQIEEIRESIRKLKQQDLDATEKEKELERIEEALAKLNEEMEQHEYDHAVSYRVHTEPVHVEIVHTGEGEKKKDVYFVGEKKDFAVGLVNDEGTMAVYFHGDHDEADKTDYEDLARKIKERLGDSYEVSSEFDEEHDRFVIKIKGDEKMLESSDSFKKMIKMLREELEKIKK